MKATVAALLSLLAANWSQAQDYQPSARDLIARALRAAEAAVAADEYVEPRIAEYAEAYRTSARERCPLLVVVTQDGCHWCEQTLTVIANMAISDPHSLAGVAIGILDSSDQANARLVASVCGNRSGDGFPQLVLFVPPCSPGDPWQRIQRVGHQSAETIAAMLARAKACTPPDSPNHPARRLTPRRQGFQ